MQNNFNLFIEKPITTNSNDLKNLIEQSVKNNLYFVEGFMYKYSQFYIDFYKIWSKKKDLISRLTIHFIIPDIPNNTFRSLKNNYPTNIFDIGCYITNLISDLYGCINLRIHKVLKKNEKNYEIFFVRSKIKSTKIEIQFGVGKKYENFVNIKLEDNSEYNFHPFFFGIEGERTIQRISINKKLKNTLFYNPNSFEKMLGLPNNYWRENQKSRNISMLKNLNMLENLSKQYNDSY